MIEVVLEKPAGKIITIGEEFDPIRIEIDQQGANSWTDIHIPGIIEPLSAHADEKKWPENCDSGHVTYRCSQYVFYTHKNEPWFKPDLPNAINPTNFVDFLNRRGYEMIGKDEKIMDGDVVAYVGDDICFDEGVKHFGIYLQGKVQSKFGHGGIYRHEIFAVPNDYGDLVYVFRKTSDKYDVFPSMREDGSMSVPYNEVRQKLDVEWTEKKVLYGHSADFVFKTVLQKPWAKWQMCHLDARSHRVEEFLKTKLYNRVKDPQDGDIVVYCDGSHPTLFGIMRGGKVLTQQSSDKPIMEFELGMLPNYFGETALFFRKREISKITVSSRKKLLDLGILADFSDTSD